MNDDSVGSGSSTTRRSYLRHAAAATVGIGLSGCTLLSNEGPEGSNGAQSVDGGSGSDTAESSAWSMFGGDPANTRALPGSTGPEAPIEVKWRFNAPSAVSRPTAATSKTLFVSSDDPIVYAVDLATGEKRWRYKPPLPNGPTFASAISHGTLFVGMLREGLPLEPAHVTALDIATGAEQWRTQMTTGPGGVSPALFDDSIVVGGVGGGVVSLDAETGEQRWRFAAPEEGPFEPKVVDETVYVGGPDTNFYAINARTGEERWRFTESDFPTSPPGIDGDTVYFGNLNGSVFALDRMTGESRWAFPQLYQAEAFPSPPMVFDGAVYVSSLKDAGFLLNAGTGEEIWRFEFSNPVRAPPLSFPFWPALAEDTIYIGSGNRSVYGINAKTGEQRWRIEPGDGWTGTSLVVGETLYVGSRRGGNAVYALS